MVVCRVPTVGAVINRPKVGAVINRPFGVRGDGGRLIGNYGMIATGNHGDFDSLRVAPRPYGGDRMGGRLIIAPTEADIVLSVRAQP